MTHIVLSRQEFLRRALAGSLALPLLLNEACSDSAASTPVSPTATPGGSSAVCTTTAAVPEGPFYKDEQLNRSDITEGKEGVRITYEFLVQDSRCQPLPGAIVDLWQADRSGVYSDFSSQASLGQTFLRGYQVTDGSGRCRFTSIFPGWYAGRLTHLHGKLKVNGTTNPTTNFFFPKTIETDVYNSPLYSGRGQNNTSVAQDVELRGDVTRYNALMMQVTGDVTNGYVARFTLTGA
jgi:protocatechuate 3,4-dioxygenase beta subunit